MKQYEEKFRFPVFMRSFTIVLATLALAWSIYYILFGITESTRWFQKLAPFIVILLSVRVLYKNLFTTNSLTFYSDYLKLGYILRPSQKIYYRTIKSLEFQLKPRKMIIITYKENGEFVKKKIPRGITDIIPAINLIVKKAPQVELDEFLSSVVTQKNYSKEN